MRKVHSFKALSSDPELAAEVSLLPFKRYPFDAAIVFADIMSPLPALGVQFDFAPGPVVAEPIRGQSGVDALRDADGCLAPEVVETVARSARRCARRSCSAGFLRCAVDLGGVPGRRARRQGLSDPAGLCRVGARRSRAVARQALVGNGELPHRPGQGRSGCGAGVRLLGRALVAVGLGAVDPPAPRNPARSRWRSRGTEDSLRPERPAPHRRLRGTPRRSDQRGLDAPTSPRPNSGGRAVRCRATSIPPFCLVARTQPGERPNPCFGEWIAGVTSST